MLLRPWVRTHPETFVSLHPQFSGQYALRFSDGGMSQPDYVRYRDSAKSLESLAAYAAIVGEDEVKQRCRDRPYCARIDVSK